MWMANKFQHNTDQDCELDDSTKKCIKLDEKSVYDSKLIYTRVICLPQYRYIDITYVLSYELSPVPASLFDETGAMRAQAQAVMKILRKKLQVEQ